MKSPRSERPSTPLQSNIGCSHQHSVGSAVVIRKFAVGPPQVEASRSVVALWLAATDARESSRGSVVSVLRMTLKSAQTSIVIEGPSLLEARCDAPLPSERLATF